MYIVIIVIIINITEKAKYQFSVPVPIALSHLNSILSVQSASVICFLFVWLAGVCFREIHLPLQYAELAVFLTIYRRRSPV